MTAMQDIKHLRIASRASPLALVQAKQVAAAATQLGLSCEILKIKSMGDTIEGSLADVGGKELFIGTLRRLLQQGGADCAVHSLKDMVAVDNEDFTLAAVGFAEDARDVFVSVAHERLLSLPAAATVGTCSPRRAALLARYVPQTTIVPMRGNIQTRLRKLSDGQCVAMIIAAAGLRRLRLLKKSPSVSGIFFDEEGRRFYYQYLPATEFIPAPGQGLLAVECLAAHPLKALLTKLADVDLSCRAAAERAFSRAIGGDCHTPLGAHAHLQGDEVLLHAFYVNPQRGFVQSQTHTSRTTPEVAGYEAAKKVLL